ncbi:FadR family transcriptional regulator [Frankia sp. CNm7]|uniref:FadR family transcriptional regulator n=1 Tax=Frankia nepalensis TaxID=1836974 RepID=A0A937URQ6_9ACTN|nr:FCD domain-containing protein [Frankia nepalensis]MBL7494979.1 FadR family transcriptional regulator [Frankia nepalensis]MBL7514656.1 FadR family transcriptional regulator [Frankia nepalensis]MBL7523123.1 FadR family transcriptional regulator [Frankia nepalensis]MBL7633089.1 FadR family transcriptional regulator [Frankia nepalensis]
MGQAEQPLAVDRGAPLVHVPKVAELVAAEVRRRIVGGELSDGDELPRESDMQDEFRVSRPSVREALRILETEGLVRIRRGKVGGGVVRRPTAASAAYHLALTLKAHDVTHQDLATARLAIEPSCASLAAGLPDRRAVVDELTRLVDESETCPTTSAFTEAAHAFHLRLTELCGNTTMTLIAGTLEAVWSFQESRVAQVALGAEEHPEDLKTRRRAIASHRRLIAAIAAGNSDQASREMRKHITDMQQEVIGTYGSTVIDLATAPTAGTPRPRTRPAAPTQSP